MVRRRAYLLFLMGTVVFSVLSAQESDSLTVKEPCESKYIAKAQKEGLRSLSLREIPFYYYSAYQCRRNGADPDVVREIDRKQLDEDYRNAKQFRGWTSSFTYCVSVVVILFYVERMFNS